MALTMQLARWAAGAPRDAWSASTHAIAAHALEDVIASAVAGLGDPGAERLRRHARSVGAGRSAVFGSAQGAPAQTAALVNGYTAHAAEMDDNFLAGLGHSASVIYPALLALGDELGARLSETLDAFIVGTEVMARVAHRVTRAHTHRGWHGTSTLGAIAAAAACARLLDLDAHGQGRALSLATSMAAGHKAQFGYEAKPLQAGLAAHAGVLAARLAAAGMSANLDAIDDRSGFAALYGDPSPAPWQETVPALERWGLAFKRHPCCAAAHRTLDGLLALRERHGFAADDVQSVVAEVEYGTLLNLRYPNPATPAKARFSLPYCAAVALRRGRLTLADFHAEALHDAATHALMARIDVRGPAAPAIAESPDPGSRPPHRVQVLLRDGRMLHEAVRHARGTAANPFTAAERDVKFADCCAGVIDATVAATLLDCLRAPAPDIPVTALTSQLQRVAAQLDLACHHPEVPR